MKLREPDRLCRSESDASLRVRIRDSDILDWHVLKQEPQDIMIGRLSLP